MKIAIIGAGAMGCLYGGKLSSSVENEVFLIDIRRDYVEAINRDGIFIEENNEILNYKKVVSTIDPATVGVVDLAVIFVKSTETKEAIEGNKAVFGNHTLALTLQNGLGNIEILSEILGQFNVIAGTTAHGAYMKGPGRICHAGQGLTVIGKLINSADDRILAVINLLNQAGIEATLSDNVLGLVWDKLLVNVGINALTAITGLLNGELLDYPEIENILEQAVAEGMLVAEAKGIQLQYSDPIAHTKEICRATALNKSSMLQDILNHRKTEVEMINGAIFREGSALGISAPVNETLANLVRFREKQ